MTNSPYYAKELMSEEGMIIILNQNFYLCHLLWCKKRAGRDYLFICSLITNRSMNQLIGDITCIPVPAPSIFTNMR